MRSAIFRVQGNKDLPQTRRPLSRCFEPVEVPRETPKEVIRELQKFLQAPVVQPVRFTW